MYTAELTTAYKDAKRQYTSQPSPVSSTTQSGMTSTLPRGKRWTDTTGARKINFMIAIFDHGDTAYGGYYIAVKMLKSIFDHEKMFR